MIRLQRPTAPDRLIQQGTVARDALIAQYVADPSGFVPQFEEKLYQQEQVKLLLIQMQHGKCAFCESNVTATGYGDVEHYRPKGGYRQKPSDQLHKPGYFWLAYDWDNLFFSCQLCNQKFKKNHFPLVNPNRRASSPNDDLSAEEPILLNPCQDDPDHHLEFEKELLRGKSKRGTESIKILGLNRDALCTLRRDYYIQHLAIRDLVRVLEDAVQKSSSNLELKDKLEFWKSELQRVQHDSAPYAAMIRAMLR